MKTLTSPALACRECDQASQFATLDIKTQCVTYKCALCGDEFYDTNLDDYYTEAEGAI